ncbi:MAG: ATP-binding protein [Thermoanaerobaculia bacterium]|nr:ATP-binding protein [Thermoanaerobaculia bacterium]
MGNHGSESPLTLSLRIDSRLEDIALVGVASRALAMHAGLGEVDAFNVELCVVEAVTNSVEHGYRCEAGHPVDVEVRLTPTDLEFEVKDRGQGMEPDNDTASDEVPTPPPTSARGRGSFLIDQLMDRVVYKKNPDGVVLTMSKSLNHPQATEA